MAVVFENGDRESLAVVPTGAIEASIERVVGAGDVAAFCIGHATTSDPLLKLCRSRWPSIPLHVVDETNTTYAARARYYEDHPPRGFARLIPRGLLVPSEPLDGYAALLIAERFLATRTAFTEP
ncbi:MAG TPA: hypothetical protein VEJ20_10290 [Candidatus Eremiobacteraceae bacterium]|nr:hypothetical protein [Candidatus Eremiobacteraceae bacterium]